MLVGLGWRIGILGKSILYTAERTRGVLRKILLLIRVVGRCSCDVPAHSYTFSWEGNPRWSKAYVGAEELFDYFKGRAIAYGVHDHLHLQHRVTSANWNEETGKWKIKVEDLSTGATKTDEAEILINAAGFLNKWKWPDIPGLHSFKGNLMHSARWDDSYDYKDKNIAVVGSGSSGIQIVPQLQPGKSRVPCFCLLTSFNPPCF